MLGRYSLHVLFLVAFALPATVGLAQEPAFDAKAAAFIHKDGKATIQGHAFLRRPDNAPEHAVGQTVRLIPVTPYSEARFQRIYGDKHYLPAIMMPRVDVDPEYAKFTRTTTSESNGRFTCENVAPGKYYVTTQIFFEQGSVGFIPKGGSLYGEVTVTGKETKAIKVVLTGP